MRRGSFAVWLALVLAAACALDESGTAESPGGSGGTSTAGGTGVGGVTVDATDDTLAETAGASAGAAADAPAEDGDAGFSTALHGKRIEIPCGLHTPPGCAAGNTTDAIVFEGTSGIVYDVTLRFRGVVEQNGYVGGTPQGFFYAGGTPDNVGWNRYWLEVSSPGALYFLNSGATGILHCFAIDYEQTIPIAGGASVMLGGDAMDGQQVINVDDTGAPIVIPDVAPAPSPYDGQFIQIDVVSMKAQ